MIYTVVCTDINDYVNWQVELLEYSWSRINQPGKLIRLVACEEDADLPVHRHAEVIRTRPTNVHPESGDDYPPYNRLYSLHQWLEEYDIDGTILVVDCDVVFTAPIKTVVDQGAPLGQHWIDHSLNGFKEAIQEASAVSLDAFQPVTWPMLIDANDLRALMPRWIEAAVVIREKTKRQESDMYAMLVAAAEEELEFQLGDLTAFMPWPDEKVKGASLIHYCQVVKDIHGQRLWGKWGYKAWDRVPNADQAGLMYCRVLLNMVDEFARLKKFETTHKEKTIFISIASYCDAELLDTIESCLQKARYPENLRFGICHQYDNSDELTSETCLDRYSQDTRFRYVLYDYPDSKGGCWARGVVQELYDGETYTLQVDSHTQMVESWDTILIEMLESMPSDKPLITQSPPLYSIEENGKNYRLMDDFSQVSVAVPIEWSPGGWLDITQKLIPENNVFPRYTRTLSCGFLFTTGEWGDVVRQDPKYLYVGEEFALSLRSFTHGYDLFEPSQIVCWHRLHPAPNRKYRNDNSVEKCKSIHDGAIRRLQVLMQGDPDNELGKFGLGDKRTLEDYAQFTGIDCANRTLTLEAQEGELITLDALEALNNTKAILPKETKETEMSPVEDTEIDTLIDVTIHTQSLGPILLVCDEQTPVLLSLFEALQNKSTKPNDLIYLELGENGQENVYFKNKELVSIETSPQLSDVFFARLPTQALPTQAGADSPVPNEFNDEWKIWIWNNVSRGCSKDSLFKQLIEHGFSWHAVSTELNHQPSVPLDQIVVASTEKQFQKDYQPNPIAHRFDTPKLEIYQIDDFLNQEECDSLLEVINENHTRSKVVDDAGNIESKHRTSSSCSFVADNEEHQLAMEVASRLCKVIGLNPDYAEVIQGQLYAKGQEYKAHYDWFEPGTKGFDLEASEAQGGQRTWSVVVYLNDVIGGGETRFENIDLTVFPKRGRMVFWYNLNNQGEPNYDALHQACPVLEGTKAILTLWFRSSAFGEFDTENAGKMYLREQADLIPAYTSTGFEKRKMSAGLLKALSAAYKNSSDSDRRDEPSDGGFLNNQPDQVTSEMIDISQELRQQIIDEFLPVCEEWSQSALGFSALYGIRDYARDTWLKMHTDTRTTHIISVILNISQQVDEDWPLEIEDHMRRCHSIMLQPGEVVLYEGARLRHGRPSPFKGEHYANIFLHFCPKDLKLT